MRTNKSRHISEICCSTVEQQRFNREGASMSDSSDNKKWTISQVERLISLPRRYIQRCCYTGKGGVGIVQPKESEWGHRYYEVEDIAKLYLVTRYRDRGHTLPEAKQALEEKSAQGHLLTEMLASEETRLSEELEELQTRLVRAQALKAALSENSASELDALMSKEAKLQGLANPTHELLSELPGLDLAIELRYGSGASEAHPSERTNDDRHN